VKPLKIKAGSVTVKVYCVPSRGRKQYEARWKFGGQIHRAKRGTRAAAVALAELQASSIANGQTARLQLTDRDAFEYQRALQIIRPIGRGIIQIAQDARDLWDQKQKLTGAGGALVQDLVTQFLDAKKAEGIGDYYQRDFGIRLTRFAADFKVAFANVQPGEIETWLNGLKVGPRTWNNYLAAIRSLAVFCIKKKLVPAEFDAASRLDLRKIAYKRPGIYSPIEIRNLLLGAGPNLARCIALSAFAGLRTEEVAGIRWEDFKWERKFIHVSEEVAKTRQHSPPILDALLPWLGTIQETGPFSPYKDAKSLSGMKVALGKRLGIPARRNGLRKSWISYRLAIIQNEAQVADEAGSSIPDIHRNYLNRPSLQEGRKWFGIRPNFVPQNITQLAFASIS
jgi:integrase